MKIAIYARVSTDKQDNENQLVQLREFADKQDWGVFAEYVDRESGAKKRRPPRDVRKRRPLALAE